MGYNCNNNCNHSNFSNPIPEEPENLPPETWSYYKETPHPIEYIVRHRNEIITAIFLCAIGFDIIFLMVDYRKNKE